MSIVNLPSGYRQVEYIESTGTQYIDTLVSAPSGFRAEIDFALSEVGNHTLIGTYVSSTYSFVEIYTSTLNIGVGNSRQLVYSVSWQKDVRYQITASNFANDAFLDLNGERKTPTSGSPDTNRPSNNLYLLAFNANGTATGTKTRGKLYSCKIYGSNGACIRDYVPCITDAGEVGLYDDINAKFYGNSGTGVFTAGRKVYKESEVAKLEYIKSDGSQYIDTEFKPNNNTRLVISGYNDNANSAWIYGAWNGTNSGAFAFLSSAKSLYYGTQTVNSNTIPVGDFTIDHNKNAFALNGATVKASEATFTGNYALFLFALNNAGTVSSGKLTGRIKLCQIYDNGTLARDYYPAEVDGAIGLWDALSGVLYTDAAGGTFIAGPYLAVDTPTDFEQILAVYLRWGAVDCEAYKIYRNGSLIGTTTDTHYIDLDAEQNTEYTYTLIAYRGATESEPTKLTVYTRSGYFVIKPLIESAFFQ